MSASDVDGDGKVSLEQCQPIKPHRFRRPPRPRRRIKPVCRHIQKPDTFLRILKAIYGGHAHQAATTNPANHAQENLRLEMSQAPE